MNEKKTHWIGALFFLLPVLCLQAQRVTSRVDGTIKDPSGAIVPLANVTLNHSETNVTAAAFSNENGFFVFPQIPAGRYRISVEKSGFRVRW